MLKIACLSQKGGVGKSTLSRLIAVAYAHGDWAVKIADFNVKQKTSTDWAALRMTQEVKPEIAAEPFAGVRQALKQAPNYDLMVFDGRPDSDVTTLDIAREADLIIVPVGISLDDLAPQVRFANELRSKGIDRKIVRFAINKTVESNIAVVDARLYIDQAGYEAFKIDLPHKVGYQIAQNTGRSLMETAYPTLNERAGLLAQEIAATAKTLTMEAA